MTVPWFPHLRAHGSAQGIHSSPGVSVPGNGAGLWGAGRGVGRKEAHIFSGIAALAMDTHRARCLGSKQGRGRLGEDAGRLPGKGDLRVGCQVDAAQFCL